MTLTILFCPGFTEEAHIWMTTDGAPEVVMMGFERRDFPNNHLLEVQLIDDAKLQEDPVRFNIQHELNNFGIYRRTALSELGGSIVIRPCFTTKTWLSIPSWQLRV